MAPIFITDRHMALADNLYLTISFKTQYLIIRFLFVINTRNIYISHSEIHKHITHVVFVGVHPYQYTYRRLMVMSIRVINGKTQHDIIPVLCSRIDIKHVCNSLFGISYWISVLQQPFTFIIFITIIVITTS